MTTTTARPATTTPDEETVRRLAGLLVDFLQTGVPPQGLFAPDVFCDLTVPQWRLQATGPEGVTALRRAGHPATGTVPRSRIDRTETGFLIEVEERWEAGGDHWYCRELMRIDVRDGAISAISVYCTGDWDSAQQRRHAEEVQLIRP
ncbi:hypothetical protein [Kitasatospora sp. DSM 101779]|uniref:hypothetical protein n=1 Tax=Kitasatospora sp. DSM 101779 TaxID=2853165 RepID=UPI0021D88157|nr:hypothetical protein [Kitasatospora sp. DSM 101779]MCU7821380.1 hypothetical protein [Kitasatospora sp. DSM 101779]